MIVWMSACVWLHSKWRVFRLCLVYYAKTFSIISLISCLLLPRAHYFVVHLYARLFQRLKPWSSCKCGCKKILHLQSLVLHLTILLCCESCLWFFICGKISEKIFLFISIQYALKYVNYMMLYENLYWPNPIHFCAYNL